TFQICNRTFSRGPTVINPLSESATVPYSLLPKNSPSQMRRANLNISLGAIFNFFQPFSQTFLLFQRQVCISQDFPEGAFICHQPESLYAFSSGDLSCCRSYVVCHLLPVFFQPFQERLHHRGGFFTMPQIAQGTFQRKVVVIVSCHMFWADRGCHSLLS